MTNFVLLFSGGGMPETEEEQAKELAAWGAWYEGLGASLADAGNPFSPVSRTVTSDSVSEGVSGTPNTGYTIVSADSLDAATGMAKGCPILVDGGTVAVYETFNAM